MLCLNMVNSASFHEKESWNNFTVWLALSLFLIWDVEINKGRSHTKPTVQIAYFFHHISPVWCYNLWASIDPMRFPIGINPQTCIFHLVICWGPKGLKVPWQTTTHLRSIDYPKLTQDKWNFIKGLTDKMPLPWKKCTSILLDTLVVFLIPELCGLHAKGSWLSVCVGAQRVNRKVQGRVTEQRPSGIRL